MHLEPLSSLKVILAQSPTALLSSSKWIFQWQNDLTLALGTTANTIICLSPFDSATLFETLLFCKMTVKDFLTSIHHFSCNFFREALAKILFVERHFGKRRSKGKVDLHLECKHSSYVEMLLPVITTVGMYFTWEDIDFNKAKKRTDGCSTTERKARRNIWNFVSRTWWPRNPHCSAQRRRPSAELWPPSPQSVSSSGSSGCVTATTPGGTQKHTYVNNYAFMTSSKPIPPKHHSNNSSNNLQ